MLWLAGLMGLVGASAASVAAAPMAQDVEQALDDRVNRYAPDSARNDLLAGLDGWAVKADSAGRGIARSDPSIREDGSSLAKVHRRGGSRSQNVSDLARSDEMRFASTRPLARDSTHAPTKDTRTKVELGDWIDEGAAAEVVVYDKSRDSLMVVWDDLKGAPEEPIVRVASDPFDAEVKQIVMNDRIIAEVYGDPGLSVRDVTMISLSSALIVGLRPA